MIERDLGRHEEAIRQLQIDMAIVRGDTRQILLMLAEQKGERKKTARLAAAIGAGLGSAITLIFKVVLVKLGFHA